MEAGREDLSSGTSFIGRDHGCGDGFVSGSSLLADWPFCNQSGDDCGGNDGVTDYQCGISGVRHFCHIFGSAGGIGKGRSVSDDFIIAICVCNDPGGVCAQPNVWCSGSLAWVLGDRNGDGSSGLWDLSKGIESIKFFLSLTL